MQPIEYVEHVDQPRACCKHRKHTSKISKNAAESRKIWEIQTGAHKRGLKPQIFRENRAKILPGKSGLFGPDWSLSRAYRGLFGADWDRFLRTSQPRGAAEIPPKGPFWAQLAPFGLSPRLLSPRLDFPKKIRVAQEPNRNRKPEPFSRSRKRNRNRRNRFPGTETGTGTVLSC